MYMACATKPSHGTGRSVVAASGDHIDCSTACTATFGSMSRVRAERGSGTCCGSGRCSIAARRSAMLGCESYGETSSGRSLSLASSACRSGSLMSAWKPPNTVAGLVPPAPVRVR